MSIRPWSVQVLFAGCMLAQTTTPIDNNHVKVTVSREMPRVTTPLHEHKFNRVLIYEQAGTQQVFDVHRKPYVITFKAGEVRLSPAGEQHSTQLYTPDPVTIVEIDLRDAASPTPFTPGPLDPVNADPQHYKVEFDNPQVRVTRVKIGPHDATPMHEHTLNRVVTYLTDQDFRITSEDGKVEHAQHKAGDVVWSGPAKHKEENVSDKPFEAIITELKTPVR